MTDMQTERLRRLFNRRIKEARIGDREAQYAVGLMYAQGEGVELNVEQALKWISAAAEKQHPGAQYLLANAYASGAGAPKSEQKALLWFLRAAEAGYDKAWLKLGKFFESSHSDLSQQCYSNAADQGLALAQYKLAERAGKQSDPTNALVGYRRAAAQGVPAAQFALGKIYEQGLGVDLDVNQAGVWFRKAAAQGHPAAQMALEQLDAKGWGRGGPVVSGRRKRASSRERRLEANDRWERYANRGEPEDQFQLGLMYAGGHAVATDEERASYWFELAASTGHTQAQLALARYLETKQAKKAAYWYSLAADQGDADAAFALGRMHASGEGVQEDALRSFLYFSQAAKKLHPWALLTIASITNNDPKHLAHTAYALAAEQGVAQAQHEMGMRFATGQGVAADDGQACVWYARAAEQGHVDAQCSLAMCYLLGRGVAVDREKALALLQNAAIQGHSQAQWQLGKLYADGGDGLARDARQAGLLFKKSANAGFAPAQATLGTLFAKAKKFERALEWWEKAADQGDPEALFNLALALRHGQGIAADPQRAFSLLLRAADEGLPPAQARLGLLYVTGDGVAQDSIEACKWFMIAAHGGDEGAVANSERAQGMLSADQWREGRRRADQWLSDRRKKH